MTCQAFAPVNGIPIIHIQDLIPENHVFWKYAANVILQSLHNVMDSVEIIDWIINNIPDTDTWRTVFDKEYQKLIELEAGI